MAGFYGDSVAKTVTQGAVAVVTTRWSPLCADSSSPLAGRRQLRIQLKSNPGGAMALRYVSKNADGTFTTPTASDVKLVTIMPGNTTWVEPIGDAVQVFGRLVKKKGFTDSSIRSIVTEYA